MECELKDMTAIPRPEYPRPQFERADWINLNGPWSYCFDFGRSGTDRRLFESKGFDGRIIVPFCPESELQDRLGKMAGLNRGRSLGDRRDGAPARCARFRPCDQDYQLHVGDQSWRRRSRPFVPG